MSEQISSTDLREDKDESDEYESIDDYPNLVVCSDCGYWHSQAALICPECGRLIQPIVVTVDRQGWPWTIGWGILAAGAISAVITILFWLVIILLFGVARATH
jgi:hypothetical protein